MKSGRPGRLIAVCLGTILASLLAEAVAATHLYRQLGKLIWLEAAGGEPSAVSIQALATDGDRLRLHPYYGYMALPGMRLMDVSQREAMRQLYGEAYVTDLYSLTEVDRDGFWSNHEDGAVGDPRRRFLIAVFGGSVALQFGLTMEATLATLLADHPVVAGRKVIVRTFANGGTKQPQEVTALAYMLARGEKFDYVINIDGFNELFIAWYNLNEHSTTADMPFARFINGIQSVATAKRRDVELQAAAIRKTIGSWDARRRKSRVALWVVFARFEYERARRDLAALEERITKIPPASAPDLAMPLPTASQADKQSYVSDIADLWLRSSIGMKGLSAAYHVPYLHVLQPNQYFDNAHFTENERKQRLGLELPPLGTIVPAVYREYLRRQQALADAHVSFLDASDIFKGEGSYWIDNCCHFNERGNVRVAEAIASHIRRTLTSPGSTESQKPDGAPGALAAGPDAGSLTRRLGPSRVRR